MPQEKTMPDYTGWKLANGYLCCPRCLARIVIKEREPYITMILRVADEHVCYAEAKIMYAAKSAAWRLPPLVPAAPARGQPGQASTPVLRGLIAAGSQPGAVKWPGVVLTVRWK